MKWAAAAAGEEEEEEEDSVVEVVASIAVEAEEVEALNFLLLVLL